VTLSTSTFPTSFSIPVVEKLTKTNYRLWRAQILPTIRVAQLEDLLTGVDKEPDKTILDKTDDTVIQKTREILMGVTTLTSSAEVYRTLETMFGSPTQARCVNTRITLATAKKGTPTMVEFYSKMKGYTDEMTVSGQTLGNDVS
jgi:hypothetical protein